MSERWHELLLVSQDYMSKLDPQLRGVPTHVCFSMADERFTLTVWPTPESKEFTTFAVKIGATNV